MAEAPTDVPFNFHEVARDSHRTELERDGYMGIGGGILDSVHVGGGSFRVA
jgi:hypothetical protein